MSGLRTALSLTAANLDWIGSLQSVSFRLELPMSGGLLWVENGDPIFKAFIFFRQVGSMVEILSMATHPDFRQKGVMRELFLDFILRFCKPAQVIEIWLEVHEKNSAALKAYGSLGFITTGERPNYYQDRARAILMTYPLAKSE